MNQEAKLSTIKDILLTDEREFTTSIEKKIAILEKTVNERNQLSKKINTIIDEKLNEFIKERPNNLGPTITEALKKDIKNSQDAVVEVLFPILGKMVKRFLQHDMKLLSEKINNAFSFKGFFRRKTSKLKGVNDADDIIQQQSNPKIEQIIFIKKGSGLVLAEYSKEKTTDEDRVAGMLTAIKSFIEDAFINEHQDLNYIEYHHYHIHLQNLFSYYIAVVVSGAYNVIFKDKLEDNLLTFTTQFLKPDMLKDKVLLTKEIKKYFENDTI